MAGPEIWKLLCVFVPILSLLVLGVWLTLRSGVPNLATVQGARQAAVNLTHTVVLVALSVAIIVMVQQLVGYRLQRMW